MIKQLDWNHATGSGESKKDISYSLDAWKTIKTQNYASKIVADKI